MNILSLDLGTKCGWAIGVSHNGVWNLKPSTHETAGRRWVRFRNELENIRKLNLVLVVYEEVHMHMGVEAAHVYGGLVAILQQWCLDYAIEYQGVGVGTIKKHATGKGNANKDAMIKAAVKLYPAVNVIDDNHADALCLLHYALNKILL